MIRKQTQQFIQHVKFSFTYLRKTLLSLIKLRALMLNMAQSQAKYNCTYCSRAFKTSHHLTLHQTSLACNKSNVKVDEVPNDDSSSTEKTTREMLNSINKFMENSDATDRYLDKMIEESEKELANMEKPSKAIKDFDLSVPEFSAKRIHKVPLNVQQPKLIAPKPPQSLTRTIITRNPNGLSSLVKFQPIQCIYCGKPTKERISLAKHMISQHWGMVRDAQGGGRRDNSSYYANIEDSRVIKPTSKAIFKPQKPSADKSSKNPKWLSKLIGTKIKTVQQEMPFEKLLDLPKNDSEACDVCDDDFNWPDEDHQCAKTVKKQNPQTVEGINSLNLNKEIPVF